MACFHPGGNPGANLKSISHRCYLREVAFEWKLTKETTYLPLGCLQGGVRRCATRRSRGVRISWPRKTITQWRQLTVPVLKYDCLIGFVACKYETRSERCVWEHHLVSLSKECAPIIARQVATRRTRPSRNNGPGAVFARRSLVRASVGRETSLLKETSIA